MNTRPVLYALLSALLFGISTPAAKVLVGLTDPAILAGLLYCGAGLGAAVFRRVVRSVSSRDGAKEAALRSAEQQRLAGPPDVPHRSKTPSSWPNLANCRGVTSCTAHGIGSGTDRNAPWFIAIVAISVACVGGATAARVLRRRSLPGTP